MMFLRYFRAMSPPGSVRIGMVATVLTVAGMLVVLSPFGGTAVVVVGLTPSGGGVPPVLPGG